MTKYAIVTDLNRCVGCLACSVACKGLNEVTIGHFWNRVVRMGPNPEFEGADYPDVYMYFVPVTCQHCADAPCVNVCPTGAIEHSETADARSIWHRDFELVKCPQCGRVMGTPESIAHAGGSDELCDECRKKKIADEMMHTFRYV